MVLIMVEEALELVIGMMNRTVRYVTVQYITTNSSLKTILPGKYKIHIDETSLLYFRPNDKKGIIRI